MGHSTAFEIASVEAFHVVERGRSYWAGLGGESRASSDRYVLKAGWRAAYGRGFETAIVKVTLVDGTIGWGEATEPICPEVICRLAVHLIAPFVGGRALAHPIVAWDDAYELQRVRGHTAGYILHAMAAVDIAVWDAIGRREGLPMSSLLSAHPASSVPAYLSGLRRGSVAERIELLSGLVAENLPAVKIFATNNTAATLAEIDALRSGVAGNWDLMVDVLWSYDTVVAAAEARRAFGERDVRWLECPLIPEDLDAHRELSKGDGAPIALGEHFFTHHQSEPWFRAGAFSVFQPDIGRTGVSDGMRQTDLAKRHGLAVTPHMGSGSPIVQATALHFWAGIRSQWPCEYQFDLSDVLPGAFSSAWVYDRGAFSVPDRPGLGVAVDEDVLAANSNVIERWHAP